MHYLNLALNNLASVRVSGKRERSHCPPRPLSPAGEQPALNPSPPAHPLFFISQGLARCESLARLDLSANFIRPARLRRSVAALARAPALT